ncbi:unnamed protein product [Alternaria alternata]
MSSLAHIPEIASGTAQQVTTSSETELDVDGPSSTASRHPLRPSNQATALVPITTLLPHLELRNYGRQSQGRAVDARAPTYRAVRQTRLGPTQARGSGTYTLGDDTVEPERSRWPVVAATAVAAVAVAATVYYVRSDGAACEAASDNGHIPDASTGRMKAESCESTESRDSGQYPGSEREIGGELQHSVAKVETVIPDGTKVLSNGDRITPARLVNSIHEPAMSIQQLTADKASERPELVPANQPPAPNLVDTRVLEPMIRTPKTDEIPVTPVQQVIHKDPANLHSAPAHPLPAAPQVPPARVWHPAPNGRDWYHSKFVVYIPSSRS